jgi:hypothetical protein
VDTTWEMPKVAQTERALDSHCNFWFIYQRFIAGLMVICIKTSSVESNE